MRNVLIAFFILLSSHAVAQPGPPPDPWSYGPSLSIFYNNGEIDIGTPTAAGTLGPGWFNASGGFAVNGVALPGAFGSQSANRVYASPCGSSGTPTFRAICGGDLPSTLSLGGTLSVTGQTTLGNAAINGVLSGSGVSTYLSTYLASPPSIGSTTPGSVAATTLGAKTNLTIGAAGVVGNGVTNNNTALQAAFTAAASGGKIQLPCGNYVITAAMTVTVASGSQFDFGGSGQNCTKLEVQGAVGGMVITQADETSGVSLHDFTLITNQAGGQTAITIVKTTANVLFAYAAPTSINNVSAYGSDYPSLPSSYPTKYWGTGFALENVNLVAMNNPFFIGGTCAVSGPQVLCNGNAITYSGNISLTSYAVVLNVYGANIGLCNDAFTYGDYAQGVTLSHINVTGCRNGVVVAGGTVGDIDQLEIDGSQFNNYISDVNLTSTGTTLYNAIISNNLFLFQNNMAGLVINNDAFFVVTDNSFNPEPTGTTAIAIAGPNNVHGVIDSNNIAGDAIGLSIASGTFLNSIIIGAGNKIFGNTLDYSITSTPASGSDFTLTDTIPRFISVVQAVTCNAANYGSRMLADDTTFLAVPTYHAALAGSGVVSDSVYVVCSRNAAGWVYD